MAREQDTPADLRTGGGGDHLRPAAEVEVREKFRLAMRLMAATVTIVATKRAGGQFGITATSVVSVSMEPPALLVSINRRSSIYGPLVDANAFSVNVLSQDQTEHCAIFSGARSGSDRFLCGTWREEEGLPYLEQAQANIFCTTEKRVDYGTHTIFIGRVRRVRIDGIVSPLVYVNGAFLSCRRKAPVALRSAPARER